jgi:hypothetical protein
MRGSVQAVKRAERLTYQCEHLKQHLRDQDATSGHPGDTKA